MLNVCGDGLKRSVATGGDVRSLWISGVVLILDQVSKRMVMESMFLGESIPVLGSFFRLTYIQNPGAVFGLRLGGNVAHLVFAGLALILVAVMWLRLPAHERVASAGLALVLGGAIGNVIDRIRFSAVIDFLDFGFGSVRWWVFNVADAAVTVGAVLLILGCGILKGGKDEAV
ncbi:MAG: signal peptidase II [Gemmatimonadota bacterium]|nr:signal peptidase II [Gemmatimonadota bacterium]